MPQIKLIAIDLDGTLLTSERKLTPRSVEAVRKAHEAGVVVCLASGRAISTILPFRQQLGIDGPIVSCNGAFVVGSDGQTIHHHCLSAETIGIVTDYAEATGVHTNLYSGSDVYFSQDGRWATVYRDRTGVRERGIVGLDQLRGMQATKILFIDHGEAVLGHHASTAKLLGSDQATIALSEAEYIEFLPPGIDKSIGLQAVAAALNLHRSEVAAIGDYLNDLEMVQWAGLGGAVSSGAERVREQADLVVASNDEDGVAEFIEAALEHRP